MGDRGLKGYKAFRDKTMFKLYVKKSSSFKVYKGLGEKKLQLLKGVSCGKCYKHFVVNSSPIAQLRLQHFKFK